jgi:glycosyltransferase involved in cell wall biosynthesis
VVPCGAASQIGWSRRAEGADIKVPKISIVATCYNCRNYVGDAIRSVARQTLTGFECVIVDDASTDDSASVIQQTLDELRDARFSLLRLETNLGQTGATRAGLARTKAPFVCFIDADDVWHEHFLERHLAAHMNETCAVGFTACNARIVDGEGALLAGTVYWFGRDRAETEHDQDFVAIEAARVPAVDPDRGPGKAIVWQGRPSCRLYTKRSLQWVWVSTSSMMFRRALVDLVFPDDDEVFRLHMDFYLVLMAQLVAGSLLIDEPLYAYRLHGRNQAASNPVLGGRLHLSPRPLESTYGTMVDRMRTVIARDRQRFIEAMGAYQYEQMVLAMQPPVRPLSLFARLFGPRR